jgi:hypothetical protein
MIFTLVLITDFTVMFLLSWSMADMLYFGYLHYSAIVGGSASCMEDHIHMNTSPSICNKS